MAEDPAVTRFRQYLRINTVSLPPHSANSGPKPDYESAVKFLAGQAEEIGLEMQCIQITPEHPVVVLTWQGRDPSLPSVMLNSHMDVVPADHTQWDTPPFAARKKPNGDIVARGSQDMKCVGAWYLEAVRRLKGVGTQLLRTLHLTYVPDEEVGGANGMGPFVDRPEFKALNVGFCLDEGLANPKDAFTVFYGERAVWWFNITCCGNPGHGSRFVEDTAMERCLQLMSLIYNFRRQQKERLDSDSQLSLGDVTSVNVTMINAGQQHNVVPGEVTISVDMRISPHDKLEDMERMVEDWMTAVGGGCQLTTSTLEPPCGKTSTDPSDPWWAAFSSAMKVSFETDIFSAATDSRFIRRLNIPALGFSAIRNTPILLHDHNEFLNETVFLEGIDVYRDVIQSVANVQI